MFKTIINGVAVSALLLLASAADAASTLSLTSAGDGSYQLQGNGLENVAGLDITASYDAAILAAPQVVQGPMLSGAMMAVNPNNPGIIRISAVTVTPLKGVGQLLAITFTRKAAGQGIRSLTAKLIDLNGKPLASQVQLALGAAPDTPDAQTATGTHQSTTSGSGSPTAESGTQGRILGVVVPPAADQPATQQDRFRTPEPEIPRPAEAQVPAQPVMTAKASDAPQMKTKSLYTQPSVLERFRDFRGPRTLKAYVGLFDQDPLIGFRQEPGIALADGVSTVTVRFVSTPERERTSDLALMGAILVESRRDGEATNTWIVRVRPEKAIDKVTLSVPQKDLLMVFPLTVAPRIDADLDRNGVVNEADFSLFLQDRGSPNKPKYDFNGDGVLDYRDDYIFTANYLKARQGTVGSPPVSPRAKEAGKP